jgi:hypothetical protein
MGWLILGISLVVAGIIFGLLAIGSVIVAINAGQDINDIEDYND